MNRKINFPTRDQEGEVGDVKHIMRHRSLASESLNQDGQYNLIYRTPQDPKNLFVVSVDTKGKRSTSMIWYDEKESNSNKR